jgi:hypothetical protein
MKREAEFPRRAPRGWSRAPFSHILAMNAAAQGTSRAIGTIHQCPKSQFIVGLKVEATSQPAIPAATK